MQGVVLHLFLGRITHRAPVVSHGPGHFVPETDAPATICTTHILSVTQTHAHPHTYMLTQFCQQFQGVREAPGLEG